MTDTRTSTAWPLPLVDPYPALRQLRESGAAHRVSSLDAYLVVSYAEATAVLQGTEWSSDPGSSQRVASQLAGTGAAGESMTRSVLFSDPPRHTRLRRALHGHLSPRAIAGLQPRITAIVDAAMAECEPENTFDVMGALAYPVPLAVICELLDMPVDMAGLLRDETPRMVAMLDPLAQPEAIRTGMDAALGLMVELVPVLAERRARPRGDLLSSLMQDGEESLEPDEAIVMALLLLAAGHETTANLVGNGVVALHDHPHQARLLRTHPELLPVAVEELLRYESPVQLASRIARDDTRLAEVDISAGSQVFVSLAGANRDPDVFDDPERLNVGREPRGHLAFGHGAHFCAGASLARIEAEQMLSRLLELSPPLEDRDLIVQRNSSPTFRRVSKLQIHAT